METHDDNRKDKNYLSETVHSGVIQCRAQVFNLLFIFCTEKMASFVKLRVEIPVLLMFFSLMLRAPVLTNLTIYRTCYVILDFNKTECALMGTKDATDATAELEKKVQPYANVIGMTSGILDAVICSVVCVFLSSWSDKYGRRPILLISLAGFGIGFAITTLYAFCENASPWVLLVTVVLNVTGGISTFMSAALCYIADSTTDEDRGTRMGLLDAALMLGMLVGTLLSSFVFAAVGYVSLFAICTLCIFIAFTYTYFFIPESVQVEESSQQNKLLAVLSTQHLKEMFKVVFKKRENNQRAILFLVIGMMTLFIFISNDSGTLFLFLRSRFLWSLQKYTIYSAAVGAYSILGTIFVVYVLHKFLEIPETVLILVGLLSVLNSALMIGLATNSMHIYAAAIVKVLSSGINPMVRTLMSKMVHTDEMGKLFAFFVPLEVFTSIAVSPVYTLLYNSTIDVLPSAYSFMSAGFTVIAIAILMAVMFMQKKQNDANYTQIRVESTA